MRRFGAVVLTAVLAAGVALGQGNPFADRDQNDRNVGPLGIASAVEGNKVKVRSLTSGGPAERAGLKIGETIVGVEGRPFAFKDDPVIAIVLACEAAEATGKKDCAVTLLVERDGKETPVKVVFPGLGKHGAQCPKKCDKCKKAIQAGVAFLLSKQAPDGHFPTDLGGKTGLVVVTSLSALALMSAGGADAAVARAADWVMAKCGAKDSSPFGRGGMGGGGGNWNQENWELSYGAIFLAEWAKKTKSPQVKAKLEEVVRKLEANQEASGGWAHGPGGPNALGYLELEIMSNYALMGLGGAKKSGVTPDKEKLAKALAWIEQTSNGDGGVGYSPRPGQKGFGDPGRTAGAIAGWKLVGADANPFFPKMINFYRNRYRTLPEGHVSPAMHLLSGAVAAYMLGPRDWQAYIDHYRPFIYAARKVDGSFAPTPTKESQQLRSNTDHTVGPCWTTATYVLILSLPNDKVPVLLDKAAAEKDGKDKGEKGKTATGGGGKKDVEPQVK